MKRFASLLLSLLLAAAPAASEPSELDADLLARMLEEYVRSRADGPLREVRVPKLAEFGDDVPEHFDVAISAHPEQPMLGSVPLSVAVSSQGRTLRRGVVTVQVDADRSVVVARRALRTGSLIRADDLAIESRPAARPANGALTRLERAIGMRVRRPIAAGAPLLAAQLETAPQVRRGQRVKLVLVHDRLRIEAVGRAEEDGRVGDWIRARNLGSRREVLGRIRADGTLRVDL